MSPDRLGVDSRGAPAERRIIGIEVRLTDAFGSRQEVALVPCDVRYPFTGMPMEVTVTFHTTAGAVTTQRCRLPI